MRHRLTVADVMTTEVVTVPEDTGFKAVAELLAERHITAVPVTDRYDRIAGVVSETDLMRKEEYQRSSRLHWWQRWTRRHQLAKATAVTAGQLMTGPAITVSQESTIDEAAQLMAARDITRLVVTDAEGYFLVGIVTRSDLLKAYTATDSEILRRIRLDVIQHALWDDPFGVEVTVTDGVVTLSGQIDRRSLAPIAEKLTREVDGVVDVHNELTWAFDDTVPAGR